ncbi:hypothetical protein AALA80_08500 [Oscillospiraceae bacterium 50-60]
MADKKFPSLWIETGDGGKICVVMYGAYGPETHLPFVTPAEDLVAAAEMDYTAYRREIQRLYEEHPLFEPKLDISVSELEDLAAEALLLPSILQEIDPLSFFELGNLLDRALRMRDDGSASFLLHAGQRLLQALEVPIYTQIRLRNIMEVTFDGMERSTQQERFGKLRGVYPKIAEFCNPARLDGYENVILPLPVDNVYQLRLVELMLYFRQEKQRIARCDYCWNYFIPKTKARALYCDRIFDGQSCKKRGANLKRRKGPEQDDALKLFKQLRDRMYARMLRYQDAPETQRARLIPMTPIQYEEWETNARQARRKYMAGKIKAEEFLRRIDTTHELTSYDTVKQELPPEESFWQKRVAADLDFNPEQKYPASFMVLDLSKPMDHPQWQYYTREELIQKDQEGHQSLQNKYSKKAKGL